MKVRHFITTCGVVISGLLVAQGANAAVTYEKGTETQFTFNPMLALTLSGDGFVIDNLMPGTLQNSNEVTATVATNNDYGYTLSATVGNDTYTTDRLVSGSNYIQMIRINMENLSKGYWGYTLNNGTTYGMLERRASTILNKTTDTTGTAAAGYNGSNATAIKIGAYARDDQASGDYQNVINFAVTANVSTYPYVSTDAGSGVIGKPRIVRADGELVDSTETYGGYFAPGTVLQIGFDGCEDGYAWFGPGWSVGRISGGNDKGSLIGDERGASYTVGDADVLIGVQCRKVDSDWP